MRANDFLVENNESKVREYIPWIADQLGLTNIPDITLLDRATETSFGGFNPETESIHVVIGGRHPNDVLRTIAHELTHYKQHLEGRIDDASGDTGSNIENEANAVAGIIMRQYNQSHPDSLLENNDSDPDLDNILTDLCGLVLAGQEHDPDRYGMVSACILGPAGERAFGINYAVDKNRVHAERAAVESYENKYGPVDSNCVCVTTLSPCSNPMSDRIGNSCSEFLASKGIDKVYAGYRDPTQTDSGFTVTDNEKIQHLCKNFADTFLKENLSDKNPVKFTVTSPDGYKHSFQITLAVHGKHVGHFNFVRGADTDDVNNEVEVESRWQGQGYGKLLLMKAIDVANNHGLDFQQDIRGITDAQQNVYDSLENAGLIVTPGDGFWVLTPQGEQELNRLNENFADGRVKGRSRPGRVKRAGASCAGSVTDLRKKAKQGGERGKMYHWCANMKSGKQKHNEDTLDEKWSNKYKRSIDCSHPKGFSQRAHCQGRKK